MNSVHCMSLHNLSKFYSPFCPPIYNNLSEIASKKLSNVSKSFDFCLELFKRFPHKTKFEGNDRESYEFLSGFEEIKKNYSLKELSISLSKHLKLKTLLDLYRGKIRPNIKTMEEVKDLFRFSSDEISIGNSTLNRTGNNSDSSRLFKEDFIVSHLEKENEIEKRFEFENLSFKPFKKFDLNAKRERIISTIKFVSNAIDFFEEIKNTPTLIHPVSFTKEFQKKVENHELIYQIVLTLWNNYIFDFMKKEYPFPPNCKNEFFGVLKKYCFEEDLIKKSIEKYYLYHLEIIHDALYKDFNKTSLLDDILNKVVWLSDCEDLRNEIKKNLSHQLNLRYNTFSSFLTYLQGIIKSFPFTSQFNQNDFSTIFSELETNVEIFFQLYSKLVKIYNHKNIKNKLREAFILLRKRKCQESIAVKIVKILHKNKFDLNVELFDGILLKQAYPKFKFEKYVAMEDSPQSNSKNLLVFKKGELITVYDNNLKLYWLGECDGKIAFVLKSLVEKIQKK